MKAARVPLMKRIAAIWNLSSYPFPPGSQNRDGFERNEDTRHWRARDRDLTLSTATACVKLISNTISTLPLFTYRRTTRGRALALDEDLYTVLHDSPNADMTAQTFWQVYVASMLRNGVAYGEKKGTGGRVLDYLDYDRLSWRTQNGARIYTYRELDGTTRPIPRNRLFRTLAFSIDGVNEISAIEYGARIFNSAFLADVAANRTFVNGLMPTVAFSMDKILTPKQRTEFREDFQKQIGGAINAGKPPLLEGGMTASPLGINPNDAQLLESRAWSVEEICRWYGVPPFMVGHSEKSTSWGTGLEQQNIGFLTYCLRPIMKAIEQAIAKDLMTAEQRQTLYAEFAIDALLRADSAARATFYSSAVQNGWMTRQEVRALENLPFMAGADELTAQSNLAPLALLGQEKMAPPTVDDAIKSLIADLQAGSRLISQP
jgi:HK97 family phage portal protein